AGAVGPDQAVDLAALDGDAHVRKRLQAAEALGDAADFEDGVCRHVLLSRAHGLIDMGREASPGTSSAGVSTPGACVCREPGATAACAGSTGTLPFFVSVFP